MPLVAKNTAFKALHEYFQSAQIIKRNLGFSIKKKVGQFSVGKMKMVSALKNTVVPIIREQGFKGSFPHYRRILKKIHLGSSIIYSLVPFDDSPLLFSASTKNGGGGR